MCMKKLWRSVLSIAFVFASSAFLVGCNDTADKGNQPIVLAWSPGESTKDYAPAREEIGQYITKATGRKVEHKLTTDYAISVEGLATGIVGVSWLGAQQYIEATAKSNKVKPLMINSGPSGSLEDAVYYGLIITKKENAAQYKLGDSYSIDTIAGKTMSFVSNSSTSGFRVQAKEILKRFSTTDTWQDITEDDLIEGGGEMFFKNVLFGASHQGSLVNVLSQKADIGAVGDFALPTYAERISGNKNEAGEVYRIKDNVSAPFDRYSGVEFVVLSAGAVLNAPFAYNTDVLSPQEVQAIQNIFSSDEVSNNPQVFITKGSKHIGMFTKSKNERFIPVADEWFNALRD